MCGVALVLFLGVRFRGGRAAGGSDRITTLVVLPLENAASVAGMILTTEALVTDMPEKKSPAPAPGGAPDMYD